MFGSAVSLLLTQMAPDLEVSSLSSVKQVLEMLAQGTVADLILLDYDMPSVDGITGMNMIWKLHPDQQIAIISGIAPPHNVKAAIRAGAVGWLQKSLKEDQLMHAIRMMVAGATYVPAEVLQAIEQIDERWGDLTQAEHGVVRLVAEGLTDKEIAIQLEVAPKTVQMHMRKILKKAGVDNRTRLALAYLRDNQPEECQLQR